jgi:hypothetical protein
VRDLQFPCAAISGAQTDLFAGQKNRRDERRNREFDLGSIRNHENVEQTDSTRGAKDPPAPSSRPTAIQICD